MFAGGPLCHYEKALMKLETYYSFPNIATRNNCVKISIDKGTLWKPNNKIPIGCYEIDAINTLQHLSVEACGKAEKIILSPKTNPLKCILYIKKTLITRLILQLRIAC